MQGEIGYVHQIPFNDQITNLIKQARITEAIEVLKSNQFRLTDISAKWKEFYADAGWVLFTQKVNFDEAFKMFKETDIDPREIFTFYHSYHDSQLLQTYFRRQPTLSISSLIRKYSESNQLNMINEGQKQKESKESLMHLFE